MSDKDDDTAVWENVILGESVDDDDTPVVWRDPIENLARWKPAAWFAGGAAGYFGMTLHDMEQGTNYTITDEEWEETADFILPPGTVQKGFSYLFVLAKVKDRRRINRYIAESW